MKRLFSCFLFQKRPEEGLSRGRRAAFWAWNGLLLAGAAVVMGLASLVLATGVYSARVLMLDYLRHPVLLILNLLPPVLLAALLYALTGRAWLAYAITALPVLGLSVGNYYKLAFRDDPVIAADLLILGEAGKMAGQYHLFLSRKLVLVLLCAIASVVILLLFARGRPRLPLRGAIAGAALVAAVALAPVYASNGIYNKNTNVEHLNQWSTTQQYVGRGLLYPFLHSVKDALPNPPEGYDGKETAQLLAQYEDGEIPQDKKVNLVGIMLESFSDFSGFEGIEFTQDVYAQLHALEAESYSGNLLTNIFAGGTINTERAFLTGVGLGDHNYRGNTSSYAWYLKSQGYHTSGDHPSNNWFYNRQNVNAYLGFDQYRFTEDHYGAITKADTAWDYTFFPELTASILAQLEEDAPLFSFSVSYQGHGPYGDDDCWWGEVEDYIANEDLDEGSRYILSNYLGSVLSTQGFLTQLVDTLRQQEEPVVLVVFGDHRPWLGNGGSVYSALGVDLGQDSLEGFYNYWATPYLIWGNDAAKQALGRDLVGEGPDISPCFLMNVLFDQLGWEGDAYMQATADCWREVPVIHTQGRYLTADGTLCGWEELTPEQAALVQRFRNLDYYRRQHFAF